MHAAAMTLPAGRWEQIFTSDGRMEGMLPARSVMLWRKV
jgi:glycogen operon protein